MQADRKGAAAGRLQHHHSHILSNRPVGSTLPLLLLLVNHQEEEGKEARDGEIRTASPLPRLIIDARISSSPQDLHATSTWHGSR